MSGPNATIIPKSPERGSPLRTTSSKTNIKVGEDMFPYFRNKFSNKFRNTARENRIRASVRPRYCWTSSITLRPPGRTTQKRIPGLGRACRLWSHFVRHPPPAEMTLSGDNESADRLFQGGRHGCSDLRHLRLRALQIS